LAKLQVEQAHHIATGKSILVALIDSEIDAKNPDLDAAVVKSFDGLGGEDKPHTHGTAMAGAIAAHLKLMGIAPGAQLLAARAFDDNRDAKGTSFAIYKSLQWAADNGARIVNMSFAGPADPTLHTMLAAAFEKGLVLIAAAGNAGPTSPPLYPAADPNVIAVTATDSSDGLFAMANRGSYIAVAAPGVDILALAPDHALQLTTGTSVATAHVSGLVALLLECKPSLTPADIRKMLGRTAKPLGFGAGLVNAYRAVSSLNAEASGKDGGEQAKE
jgi:subtilisin family serine protease